jgi:hypothetical protein
MKITELFEKIGSMKSPFDRDPNLPDDVTTDKVLRSLRRQRRVQLEAEEKKRLKEEIHEYRKEGVARILRKPDHQILDKKKGSYYFSKRPATPAYFRKTRRF